MEKRSPCISKIISASFFQLTRLEKRPDRAEIERIARCCAERLGASEDLMSQLPKHLVPLLESELAEFHSQTIRFPEMRHYSAIESGDKHSLLSNERDKEDTLEVGFPEGGLYLMVNAEQPPRLREGIFAGMALLSVAVEKRDSGAIDKKRELRLAPGGQQLSDIRDFLKGARFRCKPRGVVGCGKGKVRLEFERGFVRVHRSLCTFESSHRNHVEEKMNGIYKCFKYIVMRTGKEPTSQKKKETLRSMRIRDKQSASIGHIRSMVRHTLLVKEAVEMMGWQFHDEQWENEWTGLLRKCDEVLELVECTLDERFEIGVAGYKL